MTRRNFLLSAPAVALPQAEPAQNSKPRLPRKDCFFGIHLDLHANLNDKALGRDLTEAMIERFLAKVKPDYVQYDCKGHVGTMAYRSNVSTSVNPVQDSLALWRKVTAREGVGLYIHFSGVWDSQAVKEHPEWARVKPDGSRDDRQTSTFGPYVDERMIPQLKEAAQRYQLDGAWVDGECWATQPDYCPAAVEAFRKATGMAAPAGPKDPGWLEFLEFNREQFRRYVKHYVDELHRAYPGFQIASNWLYTTYVPERPTLPVDYISGDYLGNASISKARLEARYIASTGKPWDLMAWGFQSGRMHPTIGPIHKPAVNLMQEAAVVLAQGGGFQIYYQPTRAGWVDDLHIATMSKVAAFCRSRQAFSHKSESVEQVGLLFSAETLYRTANKLFGGWGAAENPARGLLDALLECHYPVDVVPDWKLEEVISRYPCFVVPDWSDIGNRLVKPLLAYVEAGGRLMLAGAENAALFQPALGVRLTGQASNQPAYIPGKEVFASVRGLWQDFQAAGAEVIAFRHPTYDATRDAKPAASIMNYGKGKIAAIYGPIGGIFAATHQPETRNIIGSVMARLYRPEVEIDAPPTVEISWRKKGRRFILHLLNSTNMQVAADYAAVDFVPRLGPLQVRLRLPRAPKAMRLEPDGVALRGNYHKGLWTGTVPYLDIHAALVWEL